MSRPDGLEQRTADLESRIPDHDTRANAADAELADEAYRDAAYLAYWFRKVLP